MGSEGRFFEQNPDNPLGGVAIPQGRDASWLAFSGKNVLRGGENF